MTIRKTTAGKYFIYALLFLCPLFAVAQIRSHPDESTLTGKVIDGETRQPIPSATIILLHQDSSVVTESISHTDGGFSLKDLPEELYILRISAVGHQPFARTVDGSRRGGSAHFQYRDNPADARRRTNAGGAVVGARTAFKTEIDKKVFNVDQ